MEYATIVRQTERNGQIQSLRVDSVAHPAIEFGTVGINIQQFRENGQIAPARALEIETDKIALHREINDIQWGHRVNLRDRGVTKERLSLVVGKLASSLARSAANIFHLFMVRINK